MANHEEAVQELLRKLENSRESCNHITSDPSRSPLTFVPRSKVESLLTNSVVESVLRARCPNSRSIKPQGVIQFCPRGTCILLEAGYGQYIPYLASYPELRDDKLPLNTRPDRFPRDRDQDIWEQFSKRQWEYFPATLDPTPSNYDERCVLPFVELRELARGSTAKLYKVTLAREYDALYDEGKSDKETLNNRHYALKTYKGEDARYYFHNEVDNFTKLNEVDGRCPPGLIELHTSFQHGDKYSVLFEFANGGNLHDMLHNTEPPATGKQIHELWRALLELLKGLERIHELEEDQEDGGRKVFQGFHQDIRLNNILVFVNQDADISAGGHQTGPEYSFKLADLGISHFELATQGSKDVFAEDTAGSETFGAPETFRETEHEQRSRMKVTRGIDIWSLGCVFLTVAVWIAYGRKGVDEFNKARRAENKQSGSRATYSFHNGRKPNPEKLRAVQQEIDTLHLELKKSDKTTPEVMIRLVDRMIAIEPKSRPPAATLCADATRALEAAERELESYYGSVDQIPTPVSGVGWFAPPLRHPSGRTPRMANRPNDAQIPMTPPSRSASMQQGERAQRGIRGHSGLWLRDRSGQTQAPLPETPPLSHPGPPPGPRNSLLSLDPAATSPVPERLGLQIPDADSDEPVDDDIDYSVTPSQLTRPRHVARNSEPSALPTQHDHNTTSPPLGSPFAPPTRQNPQLSVDEAIKYIDAGKFWKSGLSKLPNAHYREYIKGRDHVFLIDDSTSLKDYEMQVLLVAKVLLSFASAADRDGVDIWCTNSPGVLHKKDWKMLLEFVKTRMAHAKGKTDIKTRLGSILSKYRGELEVKEGRAVTKMSIYVLTDGAWTGLDDAETLIRDTVKVLKHFHKRSDQLGIQFIRFGDDPAAIERLERLDKLGKDSDVGLDIVDTTEHRGNVWKMLLGSFDKTFDEDVGPSRAYTVPSRRTTEKLHHT